MAKHYLLLVHGMGKPTDAMFSEWTETLKQTYSKYSKGKKFEDQFECKSIEYDSIFEARREAWGDQIDTILTSGVTTGLPFPTKDDLKKITEDNFFTTHLFDVMLYRFIPLIKEYVIAHVITQINEVVQEAPFSSEISIIAHSLGTMVTLDAVNAMYETEDDSGNTLSPGNFRFETIAMIANVSRTLKTRWGVYDSLVKPGCDLSHDYVTQKFLSTSHKWDPLVALKRFSPVDNWPDPQTVSKGRVKILEPGIITHWNVHDFSHYLNDPAVHVPLFRMLRHPRFINKTQFEEALVAYHEANPIEEFEAYLKKLKAIIVGEADFSWKRLVEIFKAFQGIVEEFTE